EHPGGNDGDDDQEEPAQTSHVRYTSLPGPGRERGVDGVWGRGICLVSVVNRLKRAGWSQAGGAWACGGLWRLLISGLGKKMGVILGVSWDILGGFGGNSRVVIFGKILCFVIVLRFVRRFLYFCPNGAGE